MSTGGKLAGKVAVVTASTEGIGFAIAKRLAQDGAKVMISSRKQKNVDRAVKELKDLNLRVEGTVCHVAKKEDRHRMIEKTVYEFGGIDILVCNAAVNPVFGNMLDVTTEEAWDKIFDVNVKSQFFLCKEIVPYMEKRGGGSIVLVSSVGGYLPAEFLATYAVSKTALLGLTKAMVPQLSQKNIRVNTIAPGLIKTHFSEALWKHETPQTKQAVENIPMKRIGEPDECSGVVSFLVSDDASYMTGETVIVAGGVPARL